MFNQITAFGMPGGFEWIVILMIIVPMFIVALCCIIGLAVYLFHKKDHKQKPQQQKFDD